MVYRPIHLGNMPTRPTNRIHLYTSNGYICDTCIILIKQSDKRRGYWLCWQDLKWRTIDKLSKRVTNWQGGNAQLRASQQCVPPPVSEYPLLVTTSAARLFTPSSHPNDGKHCTEHTAEGVIEVILNKLLLVLLGKFVGWSRKKVVDVMVCGFHLLSNGTTQCPIKCTSDSQKNYEPKESNWNQTSQHLQPIAKNCKAKVGIVYSHYCKIHENSNNSIVTKKLNVLL